MALGFYEQPAPSLLRLRLATATLLAVTADMQCYFGIEPLSLVPKVGGSIVFGSIFFSSFTVKPVLGHYLFWKPAGIGFRFPLTHKLLYSMLALPKSEFLSFNIGEFCL